MPETDQTNGQEQDAVIWIGRTLAILHRGQKTLRSDLRKSVFPNGLKVVKRATGESALTMSESMDSKMGKG